MCSVQSAIGEKPRISLCSANHATWAPGPGAEVNGRFPRETL